MGLISNLFSSGNLSTDAACSFAVEAISMNNENDANIVSRKLYPISTEMYDGFMGNHKFEGKRIFTVGSSGDQVFEYAFRGCRDITVMDANPLTPFFIELKYAAIKSLDYQDFKDFFTNNNSQNFMSLNNYIKIREKISDENVLSFWDYIFGMDPNEIKRLFQKPENTNPSYFKNEKNYEKTKQLIESVNVKFYCADIGDFYKYTDGEYDLIDLSNIYNWCIKDEESVLNYWYAVNKLHSSLSKNGMFKISYGFYNGNFDSIKFMGKSASPIPYFDNRMAVAVWYNDEERYKQRRALMKLEDVVTSEALYNAGKNNKKRS